MPARRYNQRRWFVIFPALLLLMTVSAGCFISPGEGSSARKAKDTAPARSGFETTMSQPATTVQKPARPEKPETGKLRTTKQKPIKGIYLTAYTAGSPNLKRYLRLIERTELNAVVVDVKDVTGEVTYPSRVPLARELGATRDTITDLEALARKLDKRNIYTIARVATFQDNVLAHKRRDLAIKDSSSGEPWQDYAGNTWTSPYNREVWEYNAAIAKEAARAGFDEVQFDYVRFPSDGPMERVSYGEKTYPSQEAALAGFLEYAQGELEPLDTKVAADVFGLAATEDGARVGQFIDMLAPHLDVISPMVYPSHFPPGSYDHPDPNSNPYEMVENAIKDFEEETNPVNPDLVIRPWLQDFDLGEPPYGPKEIRAQIRAARDSGASGWLLWNQANVYTGDALRPEERR